MNLFNCFATTTYKCIAVSYVLTNFVHKCNMYTTMSCTEALQFNEKGSALVLATKEGHVFHNYLSLLCFGLFILESC